VRLEPLHFVERGQPRVAVFQAHNEAVRH
jgi:hypothetical protein